MLYVVQNHILPKKKEKKKWSFTTVQCLSGCLFRCPTAAAYRRKGFMDPCLQAL